MKETINGVIGVVIMLLVFGVPIVAVVYGCCK